jgi:SP family arabinose:H+ symporter-like MFS transporter
LFTALVVSIGGFLFGFDAGIISGVMSYAGPEFDLNDIQNGWAVSAPSFAAMLAMLFTGRLSDVAGRKKLLLYVAFLYGLSAILSALASGYHMLWIARFIGGIAFGAALVIAPAYIAEISSAKNRGKLVSVQQLNIVLGFFAAFLSNYFFNKAYTTGASEILTDSNVWRWMLGVEFIPAVIYFILLFWVPKSPRWLLIQGRAKEAESILISLHGEQKAREEHAIITDNMALHSAVSTEKTTIRELFSSALKYVMTVALVIGVLQQITGINAVYFYATSIFKQTGIGTDAAFASGIWLSMTTVVFTVVAILFIDKLGRRPLMLFGIAGIAISLMVCSYGFHSATYELSTEAVEQFDFEHKEKLMNVANTTFNSDIDFKSALIDLLGNQIYAANDGVILEAATNINATLVLVGILGFIACFAFSLGPVMWVMLSEIFPNKYRGAAVGFVASINGFVSWLVQFIFPWELSRLGNAMTFFIFGAIAVIGFVILLKILPETKGRSLEELESELIG